MVAVATGGKSPVNALRGLPKKRLAESLGLGVELRGAFEEDKNGVPSSQLQLKDAAAAIRLGDAGLSSGVEVGWSFVTR